MKAVFLDRDGTIARDVHYCRGIEEFEILPHVPEAIRLLNQHGFKIAIVTNQSGVARGYFTEETLLQIHQHMKRELAKHGACLDAILYCPHHPADKCQCRKPKPGLLLKAAGELGVNLKKAFLIGDKGTDIETGKAVGCRTILLSPANEAQNISAQPDYIADNMLNAVHWIIEKTPD